MTKSADTPLKSCPYCGSEEFFRKGVMSGFYEYRYRFDGKPADNTHLHDSLDYREYKTAFCAECKRSLGTKIIVPD